jgi:microcystin-dependent protein
MDQYLAIIIAWAGNFNPRLFQLCNGQILPISSNTALFSLLGTYYGGNGTSNFGLPDLRGRIPVGQGSGPGLSQYFIGEQSGTQTVTLLANNIPSHTHMVNAVAATGNQPLPTGNYFAEGPKSGTPPHESVTDFYQSAAPTTALNVLSVSANTGGGSNPMNIIQPTLTLTYIIAMSGVFPPRN